jgi:transposase-like protein
MRLKIPANALEFERAYSTEAQCRQALIEMRWPEGFACPSCGSERHYELRCRPALECADCGKQTSLLARTLYHGSKLPLVVLFRIVYMIVAEKNGTNAMAIHRQTGVSHRTALLWVRKVRCSMDRRTRERLTGTVEADETILGGKAKGTQGRQLGPNQALIVVLAEDQGEAGMGRVRLERIHHASEEELGAVIDKHVKPKSHVVTDAWKAYKIEGRGYSHEPRNVKKSGKPAHESLPLVHLVASLLKRYVGGMLHGSWRQHWLPLLLTEFEFRLNRRRSRKRPLLFHRVMEIGVTQRPPTRDAFVELGRLLTCV